MLNRILAGLVAVAVSAGSALAIEPTDTPPPFDRPIPSELQPDRPCNAFDKIWLWGDPTDCPNDETVPLCESLVKAALKSARRAEDVYRIPDIVEIGTPHELPDVYFNPSPLVRRYCAAPVVLTNGDKTTLYYFVQEDAGFVGIGWKVYTCILGYDRWRVYDGRCRVARPPHEFIKSENVLNGG